MAQNLKQKKGFFITFEGPEKSGKSTQAKLLSEYLTAKGFFCLLIREPGSTSLGEKIRKVLLDKENTNLSDEAEMLLYMAARAQLVKQVIKPALKQNKVVICDRFNDSTIVYQGYGLGLDVNLIERIGRFVTEGIKPDLTILLDLGPKESLFKENHKKDRIELRSDEYHKKVKDAYLWLSRIYPRRIKLITVRDDKYFTQEKIRMIVEKCLLKK